MTPGELFYWPQHEFDDGGTSNKLLVVLNEQRNGIHIVVFTTSQGGKRWQKNEGCNADEEVYFIRNGTHGFSKPTWVQLYRAKEYDADDLENLVLRNRIKSLRQLPDNLRRAIVNCYKQTESFIDHHGWLLEDP